MSYNDNSENTRSKGVKQGTDIKDLIEKVDNYKVEIDSKDLEIITKGTRYNIVQQSATCRYYLQSVINGRVLILSSTDYSDVEADWAKLENNLSID